MSAREPLALVVAVARNGVIGAEGGIPWHFPEDMKHFRRVTRQHAVIMGRATFDSIGKPLKGRHNIVVSRDRDLHIEGCDVVHSLDEAIALARRQDAEPRVIGGTQIYAQALPLATHVYLTEVDLEPAGDTYFPDLDRAQWRQTEVTQGDGLRWILLERIEP